MITKAQTLTRVKEATQRHGMRIYCPKFDVCYEGDPKPPTPFYESLEGAIATYKQAKELETGGIYEIKIIPYVLSDFTRTDRVVCGYSLRKED